jgi:hypothetical protein
MRCKPTLTGKNTYHIYSNARQGLNLQPKMCEVVLNSLNQNVPDTKNQTIWSQTKACIAKSFVNKREQCMTVGSWNRLPF